MTDFESDIHELLETIRFNQTATTEQRYNQKLNLRFKEIQSTFDEKGPLAAAHFSGQRLLERFENFWNTLHHDLTEWTAELRTAAAYYGYMMEGEKAAYDALLFRRDVWPVFSKATPMPVVEFGDPSYSYHEALTKLIWPVLLSARGIALLTSPKAAGELALRPDVVYEVADEIAEQIASLYPINFELLSFHLDKEFERAGGSIVDYEILTPATPANDPNELFTTAELPKVTLETNSATIEFEGVTYADVDRAAGEALLRIVEEYPIPVGVTTLGNGKAKRIIEKLPGAIKQYAKSMPGRKGYSLRRNGMHADET